MSTIEESLVVTLSAPSKRIKVVQNDSWFTTPVVFPSPLRKLPADDRRRLLWAHLFRMRAHSASMGETDRDEEPRVEHCASCLAVVAKLHCEKSVFFAMKQLSDWDLLEFWFTPMLDSFDVRLLPQAVSDPALN
jgi:hypothetical protein